MLTLYTPSPATGVVPAAGLACATTVAWFLCGGTPAASAGVSEHAGTAEVCAEVHRDSERAQMWSLPRGRAVDYHFVVLAQDGTPRVGPVEVAHGGQVEPSCGLAFRAGEYAAAWPFYDGVFEHEGDLTFAKLDPRTGAPTVQRVLDETKGGVEHIVDTLSSTETGYTLQFHMNNDLEPRRLHLDSEGNPR